MNSSLLRDPDLHQLRIFIKGLPHEAHMGDFEEQVQLPDIRTTFRTWQHAGKLVACAYVDSGNNLRFDIDPGVRTELLEKEILDWGLNCVRQRNDRTGERATLDASCRGDDVETLAFLNKFGFKPESVRSLHYSLSLDKPVEVFPLPPGYSLRHAVGEAEVEALVDLFRVAFGTEKMTVEERLAIMRAPNYVPDLDLVVTAPNGELCAFCICGFEERDGKTGYTDPIGTHQRYQGLGLGKAILSAGLRSIQQRGALVAHLGTSSENIPMQRLAERVGFVCVSENLWFSKEVSN